MEMEEQKTKDIRHMLTSETVPYQQTSKISTNRKRRVNFHSTTSEIFLPALPVITHASIDN